MMNQVSLLAAGCQPWHYNVCCAQKDKFAYAATLAIYIYQLDKRYNSFKLHSIMSEHKKTIVCIEWHPQDSDILGSASIDPLICIWSISRRCVVAHLEKPSMPPTLIAWCIHDYNLMSYVDNRGPIYFWKYTKVQKDTNVSTVIKDTSPFSSAITQLRWHPCHVGKIAIGHENGTMSILSRELKPQRHLRLVSQTDDVRNDSAIVALEWDVTSQDYICASIKNGSVCLLDTSAIIASGHIHVISWFHPPSAAVNMKTLAWLPEAPGMFITGDSQNGILRLWNVSHSIPIESLPLHNSGFHALCAVSVPSYETYDVPRQIDNGLTTNHVKHVSSTSKAEKHADDCCYHLPPTRIVCLFIDGGFGLYNLRRKNWDFLRPQGHSETIFDCEFKPSDCDLLATASFDGTIKVWNVNAMTSEQSSPDVNSIVYSISWAPTGINCIAAATSTQGVIIWDVDKSIIIRTFTSHRNKRVFKVSWNHKDSRRIASAGEDCKCIVHKIDGSIFKSYRHPAPVFGCDWNPNDSEMLATACEDNLVRIYNCKNTQSNPVKVFIGHSGKVFSVKWSPIREGVFCSSSDDCTVRVWDFSSTSSVSVLNGHTSYVRGILWNHEIPYILMTSSWDATIRVWDIRDETCLCVNSDHGADVYGLASHAVRPFTVASASRDSTVRLWSISSFVSCLHAKLLAGELWKNVIGNPDQLVNPSSPPLLCGKQSKAILTVLSKSSSKRKTTDLTLFAELFGTVCGENNIFDLVSIQLGCNDADLGILYKNGIMHRKHIIKYRLDQAHKEEMAKFGNIGIGNKTKKFQLSSAARLHLRAGNIQRYCELMIELGQWEKALSISPAVSIDYWKSLTKRRAESLMDEDNESALEYSMACGIVDVYIDNLLGKGNLEDAYELSIANEDGYLSCPVATSSNVCFSTNVTDQGYAKKSATALSNYYFDFGSPIKAACCYLAIDDVESTLATLLRGNELELTITLGQVLGRMNSHHVKKALLYLSYKLQRHGHWNLSVDLLKLGFDVEDYLMQACMLCPLSVTDQNYLREKAGVPYIDDCLMEAKRSAEKGSTLEAIKYHLLSPEPLEGLELGVLYINKLMKNSNWDDVRNVVNWMSAIKTIKLQHSSCDRFRTELLAICAYNGGVEAIRRNYTSVVGLLMSHAIDLYKRVASSSDCVLNDVIIESELDSWNVMNYKSKRSGKNVLCQPTDYQKSMYRSLMSKVGQLSDYILTEDIGEVKVLGSNLPSYSNTHTCCLTNNVIQGPIHILEDGISAMNLNDAIMWARVNHFSPTSTGARIHPF